MISTFPQGGETGGLDCCTACAIPYLAPVAPVGPSPGGFPAPPPPVIPALGPPMRAGMAFRSSGRDGGFGPAAAAPVGFGMLARSSGRGGAFLQPPAPGTFGGA